MNKLKTIVALHLMLMIYSTSGILSKLAGREDFLSVRFFLYYGGMIFLLGFYAVGWQQIIKRLPLTMAFANKAVTVIWGIIWGALFFKETITAGKIIGAAVVMIGIILYVFFDEGVSDGK